MSVPKRAIYFTDRALEDIADILLYTLNEWDARTASEYDQQINNAINRLSLHPYVGRNRSDLRPRLRSVPVGEHIIIYRIEGDAIVIQHLVHRHRDFRRMKIDL
jgi:toxin ParE1/3/4